MAAGSNQYFTLLIKPIILSIVSWKRDFINSKSIQRRSLNKEIFPLTNTNARGISTILLVGGFSECHLAQAAIRDVFSDKTIISPDFYRFVDCHERLKHTFTPVITINLYHSRTIVDCTVKYWFDPASARPNWNWFEKDIYESYLYIIDIFITSKK
jgi:hypothetical protein